MPAFINLSGQRFGKLTALKRVKTPCNIKYGGAMWKCICDCGNESIVRSRNLISGHTKSCGCIAKEHAKIMQKNNIKHGMTHTRIFKIYGAMKERCYRKNANMYHHYGGRGIKVCDDWLDNKCGFQNFYNWAISNGYKEGLTIDRIDNDKGYSPDNCRWATYKEQNNNRSNTVRLSYNGKTQTISEWAEDIGISQVVIQSRLARGNDVAKILSPHVRGKAEKQSGLQNISWRKTDCRWVVYGVKSGKNHCYLGAFKNLEDAIKFKMNYDKEHGE